MSTVEDTMVDVQSVTEPFKEEFGMNLELRGSRIVLGNANFELHFVPQLYEIDAFIALPGEKPLYLQRALEIHNHLYSFPSRPFSGQGSYRLYIRGWIKMVADELKKEMAKEIRGERSWYKKVAEEMERENQIRDFLLKVLPTGHELRPRLFGSDWVEPAKRYMAENGLRIPEDS